MKLLSVLVALASLTASADDNWPQWRGPSLNGIAASAHDLPETWSETENIIWKTALPWWSGATPAIWGDKIFVTSASAPDPANKTPEGGANLLLLCLSKTDGTILWQKELDSGNKLISKQNSSTPSPATDGTRVFAVTGTGAVTAFTMDGDVAWKHNLQQEYGAFGQMFGYASSPLLHNGKLIIQVIHGYTTDEPSYLLAYDGATGNLLWRVDRPTDAVLESPDAYNTPTLLTYPDKAEIIVAGADYVTGHDTNTGAEVWRAAGINPKKMDRNRIIVSPVAVDGMVYSGSRKAPVLALKGGGAGDVTESHFAWKHTVDCPDVPTPACDGKFMYLVDDRGVITCLDAKTGAVIYGPERTAKGTVSSSPVVADGKIYFTNEEGVTTVIAAGPTFKLIATNTLPSDGLTLSSFAVSENRLYLRTPTHLYCIGKK